MTHVLSVALLSLGGSLASLVPSHINLGFGHRRCWPSTDPTRLRVYNSKEGSVLEPGIKQNESTNGNGRAASSSELTIRHTEKAQQKKDPPIVAALKAAVEEDVVTLYFPGHNGGKGAPSSLTQLIGKKPFFHDLYELANLFPREGPVLEAQKVAAEVFGASETWFLIGGTTCGVQAAIMAACNPGGTLIIARNSHISAISAMVLCGVTPKYIYPEYDFDWDIAAAVSPSEVEKAIKELEVEGRKPGAVFFTSPTYHGICSDLKEISSLCHSHNIPLIVDNAHGAHFGFHPQLPSSALQQGADLVVQSTHKVLCSLTQSSMLHLGGNLLDRERIRRCLQTLQTTSPSQLLLASLDATTAELRVNPSSFLEKAIRLAAEARYAIKQIPGLSVLEYLNPSGYCEMDPLRVSFGVFDLGISGYEADRFLYRDQRVVPELVGSGFVTVPFTPGTGREDVERLVLGLEHLSSTFLVHKSEKQGTKCSDLEAFSDIDMQLTPREAFFSKKRRVSIDESLGKICGELICPYPPGIPILIPGEVISKRALVTLLRVIAEGGTITGASDPLLSSIVVCDD